PGEPCLQRGLTALNATLEMDLDDFVERSARHDRVVPEKPHPQLVDVAILQRAGLVGVDLLVADRGLLVVGNRRRRRGIARGRRREAVDLFHPLALERARGVLRKVERLEDELAHLALARAAVVAGARQEQLAPRARRADVEEAPLLLRVEVARGREFLEQLRRQLERVAASLRR